MFHYPIGTRVRLASGGPVMTVCDFHNGCCLCAFRDGANVVEEWFPTLALDVVRNHRDA